MHGLRRRSVATSDPHPDLFETFRGLTATERRADASRSRGAGLRRFICGSSRAPRVAASLRGLAMVVGQSSAWSCRRITPRHDSVTTSAGGRDASLGGFALAPILPRNRCNTAPRVIGVARPGDSASTRSAPPVTSHGGGLGGGARFRSSSRLGNAVSGRLRPAGASYLAVARLSGPI